MADFDLQQTDQQVQNILNDGQSAMGAGAQTTLTTEYVMLKDVNGVYHKILKDSLTEACRNVLAGLLVNNDKGTTINQIAAIAGGDFGSVTPANLASVLGVGNVIEGESLADANASPINNRNIILYWGNTPLANAPSTSTYWRLFQINLRGCALQWYMNDTGKCWFRSIWDVARTSWAAVTA